MEHQALVTLKASFYRLTHFKCLWNEVLFVLFYPGKFPESIKNILNVYLWHFFNQWKHLTHVSEADISFFHDPIKVMKNFYSSPWWRMADTPMAYNYSHVKSINLKWLHFCFACPSSSNRLNSWMLFGLFISTITSWSGKCWSNNLNLTYLLCFCILAT